MGPWGSVGHCFRFIQVQLLERNWPKFSLLSWVRMTEMLEAGTTVALTGLQSKKQAIKQLSEPWTPLSGLERCVYFGFLDRSQCRLQLCFDRSNRSRYRRSLKPHQAEKTGAEVGATVGAVLGNPPPPMTNKHYVSEKTTYNIGVVRSLQPTQ